MILSIKEREQLKKGDRVLLLSNIEGMGIGRTAAIQRVSLNGKLKLITDGDFFKLEFESNNVDDELMLVTIENLNQLKEKAYIPLYIKNLDDIYADKDFKELFSYLWAVKFKRI